VNLGVIVFIFKLIPRDRAKSHKLFKSEFLRRFGCIYQTFYFRRSWYTMLILVKKLIMGFIIGNMLPLILLIEYRFRSKEPSGNFSVFDCCKCCLRSSTFLCETVS
jgi:hypothetical protein